MTCKNLNLYKVFSIYEYWGEVIVPEVPEEIQKASLAGMAVFGGRCRYTFPAASQSVSRLVCSMAAEHHPEYHIACGTNVISWVRGKPDENL